LEKISNGPEKFFISLSIYFLYLRLGE